MKPHSLIPDGHLQDLNDLCFKAPPGNAAEVGVYKGGSAYGIYLLTEARGFKMHLFDTFTGIPEKGALDIIGIGSFADTNVKDVRASMPNAIFHVGIFPATAPDNLFGVSFVHIDCDQYATCKAAIEYFWPRMNTGGVIAFDDYGFAGIKKAIHDFSGEANVHFSPRGIPYLVK